MRESALSVDVTFAWDLDVDGSYERVDEQRLCDHWDDYRDAVLDPENVAGALSISSSQGEALIQDELWHTMSILFQHPAVSGRDR